MRNILVVLWTENSLKQECILVGCVLPTAVAVGGSPSGTAPKGAGPPEADPPGSRHTPPPLRLRAVKITKTIFTQF